MLEAQPVRPDDDLVDVLERRLLQCVWPGGRHVASACEVVQLKSEVQRRQNRMTTEAVPLRRLSGILGQRFSKVVMDAALIS